MRAPLKSVVGIKTGMIMPKHSATGLGLVFADRTKTAIQQSLTGFTTCQLFNCCRTPGNFLV